MGNAISSMSPSASKNLSYSKFDENIELKFISKKNEKITDIFPIEIWQNIINFYAFEITEDINSLSTIMLVCKGLNQICHSLRIVNSSFGESINLTDGFRYWQKIVRLCNYNNLTEKILYQQISEILDNTKYIKVFSSCFVFRKDQSIALKALLSKNHFEYLELDTAGIMGNNEDIFFNKFLLFIHANKNLKTFGELDLSGLRINDSHIKMILPLLGNNNFRKICFNGDQIGKEGKKILAKLSPIYEISEQYTKVILENKNNPELAIIKILKKYCELEERKTFPILAEDLRNHIIILLKKERNKIDQMIAINKEIRKKINSILWLNRKIARRKKIIKGRNKVMRWKYIEISKNEMIRKMDEMVRVSDGVEREKREIRGTINELIEFRRFYLEYA